MKKILLITYYWPPSGGAGVQRPLKFVKYLSQLGYEVHVLTVDPEKASYPVTDSSLSPEVPSSVYVHKVSAFEPLNVLGLFISKKKIPYGGFANTKESFFQKSLRFVRGNFFIPDARKGWAKVATKAAEVIISKNNITNLLISSPPHSSQLSGLTLKKKFPSLKWIADLRDPWTDIYYYKDLMHTLPAKKMDASLERKVLEKCDAALVVSQPIKDVFSSKSNNIDSNKIFVIPNGFDESDFKPVVSNADKYIFTVTYTGTIADSYSPDVFFRIFKQVSEEIPKVKFRIRMIGSRSAGIAALIEKYNLTSMTEIVEYVDHDKAVEEMQAASMLLLIIPDVKGSEGILTGKLFEYIGARRPVIGLGPVNGDAAKILEETSAGRMFSRDQENEIKHFLRNEITKWLITQDQLPENSAIHRYSRRAQAEAVASIFSKLQA